MKHLGYLAILAGLALCGCETTDNGDGTTTTRWDSAGTLKAVNGAWDVYNQYQRSQHIIGYSPDGTPIYGR